MSYVLNSYCYSPSACPPFGILARLSGRTFILPKGVIFSYSSLKLFEPLAQPGVFAYNKKKLILFRINFFSGGATQI